MDRETILKANTILNRIQSLKSDIRALQGMKMVNKVDIRLSDGYSSMNLSKSTCQLANRIFEKYLFSEINNELDILQKQLEDL